MNVIDTATWRTIPTIDAALIRDSDPYWCLEGGSVPNSTSTTTRRSRCPNVQPFQSMR